MCIVRQYTNRFAVLFSNIVEDIAYIMTPVVGDMPDFMT